MKKKQIKDKKPTNYYKLLFQIIFTSLVILGIIYIVLLTAYVITLHRLYNFWDKIYVPTNITNLQTTEEKVKENLTITTTRNDDIRESDREILARLLYTEARGESIECQRAVISTVVNRLNSGKYGSTYKAVIEAKNQYDLGNKLDNVKPTQTQYDVVDYVMNNGITLPSDVMHFRSGYYHSWCTDYKQIGNMYFSR